MADDMEYSPSAGDISGGGGGNFLTKKMGPLPTWAWIGIGVVGGYFVITKFSGGSAAPQTSNDAGSAGGSFDGSETGTITDSAGNASDILTALESAMSLQAGDITSLKANQTADEERDAKNAAADKKDAAGEKKQNRQIKSLLKRRPKPKPKKPIPKHPVAKKPAPRRPVKSKK